LLNFLNFKETSFDMIPNFKILKFGALSFKTFE